MTDEEVTREYWGSYISDPAAYGVTLKGDPGVDELCGMEEDILNAIFDEYGHMDRFKLAELTHLICPEWEDPKGSGVGALPISVEAILEAVGKSSEEVDSIREELKAEEILRVIVSDPVSA